MHRICVMAQKALGVGWIPDPAHDFGVRLALVRQAHPVRLAIEARPTGWLFPGRFSGHVHPATVQRWVKRATGSSPHPFRARMATVAYRGTRDLFAVQRVLGHASPETTMVYVALCDDAVAAVVDAAA